MRLREPVIASLHGNWIDIPIDIQGMIIDNRNQKKFNPPFIKSNTNQLSMDVKIFQTKQ